MPQPIHIVFASLIGMAAVLIAVSTGPVPDNAAGLAHATVAAMSIGGDGPARAAAHGHWPFLFHSFTLMFAGALIYMAVRPADRTPTVRRVFVGIAAVQIAIWAAIWFSYMAAQSGPQVAIVLGFPLPTSWMLYAGWASLTLHSLYYCFAFRSIVFSDADEAEFQALLAEMKDP